MAKPTILSKSWIPLALLLIIIVPMLNLARSYFTGMFFYPDKELVGSPFFQQIKYEDVFFPSESGDKLHGFFMKPKAPAKGTVVHCHGNAGNVSDHFPLMDFLLEAGYNIFTFDYSGYGQSEGRPTPEGIIKDTTGALSYIKNRKDLDPNRIVLFGQSLGGAAASGAMVLDPSVRCIILESTFTTYREMALSTALGRFLFFLVPFVIPNTGPSHDLKKINERPILILHGDLDIVIPPRLGEKLHAQFPKSEFALLRGFQHIGGSDSHADYAKKILQFLDRNL